MDPYWKEQKWLTNKILNFRCPKIRFSRFPVKSHHCLVPSLSSWKNTKNLKKWKFPAFWRSPKKGFRGKLCHYPSLSSATEKRHIEKLNVPSVDVQQRLFKKKRLQGPTLLSLWFPECFCFWAKSSSPPVTIRPTPKKLANSMFLHAVVSKLQCSITLGKIPAQSVTNFLRLCNRQDKLGIPAFLRFTFEFPECIFCTTPTLPVIHKEQRNTSPCVGPCRVRP